MATTSSSIFKTSEILYLRIQTIEQRIKRLEYNRDENSISSAEERELAELYAKLKPYTRRLSEIHQLILEYSVRIKSDNERFIVIEYFVNHTPRSVIASKEYYDRSGVYKIIKKYQKNINES